MSAKRLFEVLLKSTADWLLTDCCHGDWLLTDFCCADWLLTDSWLISWRFEPERGRKNTLSQKGVAIYKWCGYLRKWCGYLLLVWLFTNGVAILFSTSRAPCWSQKDTNEIFLWSAHVIKVMSMCVCTSGRCFV